MVHHKAVFISYVVLVTDGINGQMAKLTDEMNATIERESKNDGRFYDAVSVTDGKTLGERCGPKMIGHTLLLRAR